MFGLLKSLTGLATDAAKVVLAPVEIAVDLVSVPVKLLADAAKDLANDVKSLKD
jgi:hypothetical protein